MRPTEEQIAKDFALLDEVEGGRPPIFRTWRSAETVVVLGLSRRRELEVNEAACAEAGVAVLRRGSGGGTVVLSPHTLQYSFVLPYSLAPDLEGIGESKVFCNRMLLDGLGQACKASNSVNELTGKNAAALALDVSGDLVLRDKKVAGLAIKRRRKAMLLHGTILERANIADIGRLLAHPADEPAYRNRRSHVDFLANLGRIPETLLEQEIQSRLRTLAAAPTPCNPKPLN